MPAPPKFRPVENDKMINFTATTNIEEIQDKEDIQSMVSTFQA
jgi:hypothetical protein